MMESLPKKLFLFFLVLLFFFITKISLTPHVYAASAAITPYEIFNQSTQQKDQDEINARSQESPDTLQIFSTRQNRTYLGDTIYNFSDLIICHNKDICGKQLTAMNTLTGLIAGMYVSPPASGIAYVSDALANAGIIAKPAYAQGVGFSGLIPLLPIWKATRNIAYAIIVIVMVIIGFMIIFRMKIDPKTIISIQMALPKIVLSLVLITFSYAIVGFLIDIMYLSMALIINILAKNMLSLPPGYNTTAMQESFTTGGLDKLAYYVFSGGFRSYDDIVKSIYTILVPGGAAGVVGTISVVGTIYQFFSWPTALLVFLAPPLILALVIGLGLLFTFIRLWFLLFNAYIQIIIALILGPLQLLAEAVPGKSSFGGWIRNIIANLSVFPTTVAVILFGTYFTSFPNGGSIWTPPLMGIGSTQNLNTFTAFLGLGIIFVSPSLIASVKKMIGAKPAVPVGATTAFAPLTGAVQTGMGALSQFYYGKMLIDTFRSRGQKSGGHGGG